MSRRGKRRPRRDRADGGADPIKRVLASVRAFLAELGPVDGDAALVLGREGADGRIQFAITSRPEFIAFLQQGGDEETARALEEPLPQGGVHVVAIARGKFGTAVLRRVDLPLQLNANGGDA
ncbi:hypothetical protein [Sorangium sp. So ce1000]|uniref:hypothetical protein n=1 Tax=Sorangium sp. So ce1000 TaxID=3133325 RepID=UPI003F63F0B7